MISHLNGSFFAMAVRRVDSLTSSRTTNVPTAPMLITPSFDQLMRDRCRLAAICFADVYPAKEYDPAHLEVTHQRL